MAVCTDGLRISIHAPRAGSDKKTRLSRCMTVLFQSTLPVRGATLARDALGRKPEISIHAPRAGSDISFNAQYRKDADFNPRSPCGERLEQSKKEYEKYIFQSTLPVRGATSDISERITENFNFNPRSPCGERLFRRTGKKARKHFNPRSPCGERRQEQQRTFHGMGISIHAPRAGSDLRFLPLIGYVILFQSTLPVRGATRNLRRHQRKAQFQSTLPVRGATSCHMASRFCARPISIHAPRAGSDQSGKQNLASVFISIHAPRAGSDFSPQAFRAPSWNFNPRSPCGERHSPPVILIRVILFQSTLPVRGATERKVRCLPAIRISIHAPRAGSDFCRFFAIFPIPYFNPRSPCGERRHSDLRIPSVHCNFNPRSPCGERRPQKNAFLVR